MMYVTLIRSFISCLYFEYEATEHSEINLSLVTVVVLGH